MNRRKKQNVFENAYEDVTYAFEDVGNVVDDYVLKPVIGFVSDVFGGGLDVVKTVASGGASILNGIGDIYTNRY